MSKEAIRPIKKSDEKKAPTTDQVISGEIFVFLIGMLTALALNTNLPAEDRRQVMIAILSTLTVLAPAVRLAKPFERLSRLRADYTNSPEAQELFNLQFEAFLEELQEETSDMLIASAKESLPIAITRAFRQTDSTVSAQALIDLANVTPPGIFSTDSAEVSLMSTPYESEKPTAMVQTARFTRYGKLDVYAKYWEKLQNLLEEMVPEFILNALSLNRRYATTQTSLTGPLRLNADAKTKLIYEEPNYLPLNSRSTPSSITFKIENYHTSKFFLCTEDNRPIIENGQISWPHHAELVDAINSALANFLEQEAVIIDKQTVEKPTLRTYKYKLSGVQSDGADRLFVVVEPEETTDEARVQEMLGNQFVKMLIEELAGGRAQCFQPKIVRNESALFKDRLFTSDLPLTA